MIEDIEFIVKTYNDGAKASLKAIREEIKEKYGPFISKKKLLAFLNKAINVHESGEMMVQLYKTAETFEIPLDKSKLN